MLARGCSGQTRPSAPTPLFRHSQPRSVSSSRRVAQSSVLCLSSKPVGHRDHNSCRIATCFECLDTSSTRAQQQRHPIPLASALSDVSPPMPRHGSHHTHAHHGRAPAGPSQTLPVITGDIGGTNARLSIWLCDPGNTQHDEIYAEVRGMASVGCSGGCSSGEGGTSVWSLPTAAAAAVSQHRTSADVTSCAAAGCRSIHLMPGVL
jgi:hypothetical protein